MSQQIKKSKLKKFRIMCPNPNCNYSWMYTGGLLQYATCPSCRRNVKIQDNKMETPQSVEVGSPSQIAAVEGTSVEADAQP